MASDNHTTATILDYINNYRDSVLYVTIEQMVGGLLRRRRVLEVAR